MRRVDSTKEREVKRLESCPSEKRLKALGLFNLQKRKRNRVINNSAQMNCVVSTVNT